MSRIFSISYDGNAIYIVTTVSQGCTKDNTHTLSGKTFAPKSLKASLSLLLLPLIATLTVIRVSGLTGGMDAIVTLKW